MQIIAIMTTRIVTSAPIKVEATSLSYSEDEFAFVSELLSA